MNAPISDIRPQYHFRKSDAGLLAWDVRKLIASLENAPIKQVSLSQIAELDETYWYDPEYNTPTSRSVADHAALIQAADLSFPIILSVDGRVMDGMHRIAKAHVEGREFIDAKRFEITPEPDFIGVHPDDLPYED